MTHPFPDFHQERTPEEREAFFIGGASGLLVLSLVDLKRQRSRMRPYCIQLFWSYADMHHVCIQILKLKGHIW